MATSKFARWRRHAVTDRGHVKRALPVEALKRIEAAIAAGERLHGGQVVFAVEPALPLARLSTRLAPRERALEVFGLLRVWDTEHNNGVLLYLLLADRDVEIVADRAIHRLVGEAAWRDICATMEAAFREGRFADGVVQGIEAINALLALHFPRQGDAANELPDKPVLL